MTLLNGETLQHLNFLDVLETVCTYLINIIFILNFSIMLHLFDVLLSLHSEI